MDMYISIGVVHFLNKIAIKKKHRQKRGEFQHERFLFYFCA